MAESEQAWWLQAGSDRTAAAGSRLARLAYGFVASGKDWPGRQERRDGRGLFFRVQRGAREERPQVKWRGCDAVGETGVGKSNEVDD
jgi:hypothetical protein